jgi:hypothetical protein
MHLIFCTIVLQLIFGVFGCLWAAPLDELQKQWLLHLALSRSIAIAWTMPRRSILSSAERDSLFALPDMQDGLIRHYTRRRHETEFKAR